MANKNYINNDELTEELIKSKQLGKVTDKLSKMFIDLANHQADALHYENPDDKKDCIANALFDLCNNYWKYDPEKGNAFSLMSNICYFGLCGAWRMLYPKKTKGTIRLTFIDDNGNREKTFEY